MLRFILVVSFSFMLIHAPPSLAAAKECEVAVAKDYFQKKRNLQEPDFNSYVLEQQYKIFIHGYNCMHPPFLYLAGLMAEKGEAVVEFLEKKLRETEDDGVVIGIIEVFVFMELLQTYRVSADKELIEVIQTTIDNIDAENTREFAQSTFDRLYKPRPKTLN
ncbi:MAG: hypothetical protein O7F69_00510 [Alphaproteobacteria bacterium]|nr:hypothetical protein [Alphaproteobacteria bacterium]